MSTLSQPVPATRTVWHLDPSHLDVGFAVRHLMISTVKGRFSGVTGVLTVEGDDFRTATLEATIDAATIDTREAKRDEHLRSADFFDTEKYPTITFKSHRVDHVSDGRYRLVGALTIHGVTHDVTLDVESEGVARDPWGNERAGFSAKGVINRRDFDLHWNQALETGGVIVGEDVKLTIDVELIRQATAKTA